MTNMKTKCFENIEELCEDVVANYELLESDFPIVSIIAKYDEAKQVLSELCSFGYIPFSIELHDEERDGYCDEYLISLTREGIFCEPVKIEGSYLSIESNCIYVLDNCNSKILSKISSDFIYEVSLDDEYDEIDFDEFDDYDCELECCNCCDNDMHGFTAHRNDENGYSSVSFYSTEKLDSGEMKDIMEIFGL